MIITLVSMAGVLLMLGTNKKEAKLNKASNKEDSGVPDTKTDSAKEVPA